MYYSHAHAGLRHESSTGNQGREGRNNTALKPRGTRGRRPRVWRATGRESVQARASRGHRPQKKRGGTEGRVPKQFPSSIAEGVTFYAFHLLCTALHFPPSYIVEGGTHFGWGLAALKSAGRRGIIGHHTKENANATESPAKSNSGTNQEAKRRRTEAATGKA